MFGIRKARSNNGRNKRKTSESIIVTIPMGWAKQNDVTPGTLLGIETIEDGNVLKIYNFRTYDLKKRQNPLLPRRDEK